MNHGAMTWYAVSPASLACCAPATNKTGAEPLSCGRNSSVSPPKLGCPFGRPARLSRSYLSDLTICQDFLEALLRLVRWLPSQARFGHGRPLLQDQPRVEGAS